MLALIGFALMIILMFVLIKEKMAPPLAFILLPLIAAVLAGFGMEDIAGFIKTGMNTMLSTAILFIFSISYFTMMSDAGLFDPIINFLIKHAGKKCCNDFYCDCSDYVCCTSGWFRRNHIPDCGSCISSDL